MKRLILLAITLAFLTVSCAVAPVPAKADESATKALEAKNLAFEIYIINKSIQAKYDPIKPILDEIKKLQEQAKVKQDQLDKLTGNDNPKIKKK